MRFKLRKIDKPDFSDEYLECVCEMLEHSAVQSMKKFNQHRGVSCLQHSINVSYRSFLICRRLGLDYRSAARGGLLHDFFLYDWHEENPYGGLHGFRHPKIAAINANRHFDLNKREHDVICKHMWPLTIAMPRYKETFVVVLVDKFYCIKEGLSNTKHPVVQKLHNLAY